MSTRTRLRPGGTDTGPATLAVGEATGPWAGYWLVIGRVLLGYWLLHAGLTKLLYGFDASGYLQHATAGAVTEPLLAPFASGAGLAFVNAAVPAGEFLIGLGLVVGALVRLASMFGAFLMATFYLTNHEWTHGMVGPGTLWGLLLFLTLASVGAGRVLGLDAYVERTALVERHPRLRYLLG